MDNNKNIELISSLIHLAASKNLLKKAVFSKPVSKDIVKAVATLKKLGGRNVIQIETFTADNKALHKNISVDDTTSQELSGIAFGFMQINLITTAGEC